MTDILMTSGLGIFFISLIFFIIRENRRGVDMLARPTINPYLFYTGKIAILAACGFIPAAALFPGIRWIEPPDIVNLIALVLCTAGGLIAALAVKRLGDGLVAGLPEAGIHKLQTRGIYRISRNPLYLGIFLLIISSWLYAPHPANFAAGLAAILIHHRIVLGEEEYLIRHCGDAFRSYVKKVRRYI
jgi:protein-S-isoprenylcysteine O-methyltransferase Ste14